MRGNFSDNMNIRYTRRDSNRFSCLMDQDGSDEGDEQQLDMGEIFSDSEVGTSISELTRREKNQKYNSSSSGTGQLQPDIEDIDYDSMGMEDKINLILSKVTVNENRLRAVDQKCDKMFDKVYSHGKKLSEMSNVVVSHDDRMRLLEYKSIELEARSRRNNVLFYGLREARAQQDCKRLLCEFLQVEMGINVSPI